MCQKPTLLQPPCKLITKSVRNRAQVSALQQLPDIMQHFCLITAKHAISSAAGVPAANDMMPLLPAH